MRRPHGFLHGNLRLVAATLILMGSGAQVVRATADPDLSGGYRWFAMTMGVIGALLSIGLLLSRSQAWIAAALGKAFLSVTGPALGGSPDGIALISVVLHAAALLVLIAVWESAHRAAFAETRPPWLRSTPTPRWQGGKGLSSSSPSRQDAWR